MDYDYLIASGCSFTEGCKDLLKINQSDTWPGKLGKHLGIPWANLADGGASNYDIALQPLQYIHDWCTVNPGKKPLLIFGFTEYHRIPYYNYSEGMIKSFYSPLPEHINEEFSDQHVRRQINADAVAGLRPDKTLLNKIDWENLDNNAGVPMIDGFTYQAYQAINTAMNYENLFDGAKVIWGFIHSPYPYDRDIRIHECTHTNIKYKINWPHWGRCFNRYMPNNLPLQSLVQDQNLWISKNDCHPNVDGIQVLADWFIECIENLK